MSLKSTTHPHNTAVIGSVNNGHRADLCGTQVTASAQWTRGAETKRAAERRNGGVDEMMDTKREKRSMTNATGKN